MNKQEKFKQFFRETSINDHIPVKIENTGMDHEVFNPKGKHFLNFDHFIEDSNAPKGLFTSTRTTHGFKLTRKGALYLPKNLRDSIPSLMSPYPVPVKPKHQTDMGSSEVTPIGRATGGRYIDTVQIKNPSFNINDAINGDHLKRHTNKAIMDAIKGKILLDPKFRGLGHIIVDGQVNDPSAIEMILDGRYLTVSVEMKTDSWINPMTGNSWIEDDENNIGYYPGDIVDGIPAIMVAGNLTQNGYAYATHPADVYASTLKSGYSEILDSIVERSKTPMLIVSGEFGKKLSSIFDSVMLTDNAIYENNISDSDNNQCNQEGCKTLGGDSMKELLNGYTKSLLTKEPFEDAGKLYAAINDASEEEALKSLDNGLEQLKIGGLLIDSKEVFDAVSEEVCKVNDSLKAKMEAIGVVLGLNTDITDSKNPISENNDNNVNSINDNNEVDKNKGPMKLEDVIKFLSDNKEAAKSVYDSEVFQEARDEVSNLKETNSRLEKEIKDSSEAKALVDVYKDQLRVSMTEAIELKASLDSSIQDNKDSLGKLQYIATLISDKDAKEVEAGSSDFGKMSIGEIQDAVEGTVKALNLEEIRTKIFSLTSEIEDTDIQDPTVENSQNEKNEVEVNSKFTKNEFLVADTYEEKIKQGKRGEAARYVSKMRKRGVVGASFDPNEILTLKNKNQEDA